MSRLTIFLLIAVLLAVPAIAQDTKPNYDAMSPAERDAARADNDARIAAIKANPPNVPSRGAPGGPAAAPGTVIVYDTGTFSAIPTLPPQPGSFDNLAIGNRFNTQSGNPVMLPYTITSVAFWPALIDGASTGTGGAFVSIFGTATGGVANWIDDQLAGGVAPGTWNTHIVTGAAGVFTGAGAASFQVGVWNPGNPSTTTTIPCATDCVGIDSSGTTNAQGFHGMMAEDINGSNYQTFGSWNALVRPIGTALPVELMSFSIDE